MPVTKGRAYDLIAIDLDGTLLDSQHRVPPENRAALHRAHAAGMHIVLCTGRAYAETTSTIEEIGLDLDAVVTVFGAVITDVSSGRTINRVPIPLETARELTAWFRTHEYAVLWLLDREGEGVDGYAIDGPKRHVAVDGYVAITPCRIESVSELPADVGQPVRISIIDEPGALKHLSHELTASFDGRLAHNVLEAPAWNLTVIEAFAPHVNKWTAIEELCRRWKIDPRRTVAIGDDVNDVAMLKHAGLGVAMGNARDVAKAAADRVTVTNDEFGVARLIDELLPADAPAPHP